MSYSVVIDPVTLIKKGSLTRRIMGENLKHNIFNQDIIIMVKITTSNMGK